MNSIYIFVDFFSLIILCIQVFFILLVFSLYVIVSEFYVLMVCFCLLFNLFICLLFVFYRKREKEGVELSGWNYGKDLEGMGEGETWSEYTV